MLRPFLLRRLKSDVEKGLPPKKETILKMGMTEMQKKYYAALLQKDIEAVNGGAWQPRSISASVCMLGCSSWRQIRQRFSECHHWLLQYSVQCAVSKVCMSTLICDSIEK